MNDWLFTPFYSGAGASLGTATFTSDASHTVIAVPNGTYLQLNGGGSNGLIIDSGGGAIKPATTSPLALGDTFQNFGNTNLETLSQVRWGHAGTMSVGLVDNGVNVPVVSITDGGSNFGWIQNTAGDGRVVANLTRNSTTLTPMTGTQLIVKAGRRYVGRLVVRCSDSVAAEGIKFTFDGGSATMTSFNAGIVGNVQGATIGNSISAALGTAITLTAMNGTTDHWIVLELSFVVNAAGSFLPQFAQNTHSTGTATVSLGSYLVLEDMPA